jgi:hypothetical protein
MVRWRKRALVVKIVYDDPAVKTPDNSHLCGVTTHRSVAFVAGLKMKEEKTRKAILIVKNSMPDPNF